MTTFQTALYPIAALLITTGAQAQDSPKAVASPPATAVGKIGAADVTVKYSSPAVKGRSIWGGLVPYGQVWRAGANEATTIEFSKPVKVEGKDLPAGKYSFFVVPSEQEWKIIFNKTANQWGAFKYEEKTDALRAAVKPRPLATPSERLTYEVQPSGLVLRWEKMELPISIK
ncbi:DUF2911 domain-containing protein [Hymenobacter saemangeumensis]|uniref:DUF2911 domain-containing protein n=1 Tax=Hymenobacter saemangeumensis TaxID=1084522 RepID=A0ABP8I3T4_9BACT